MKGREHLGSLAEPIEEIEPKLLELADLVIELLPMGARCGVRIEAENIDKTRVEITVVRGEAECKFGVWVDQDGKAKELVALSTPRFYP